MVEKSNYWKVDPHSHSIRSDGSVDPFDRAQLAKQAGLDAYGETDHDVWANQENEPYDIFLRRLRGCEITTGEGHLLVIAPPGVSHRRIPVGFSLIETVRRAKGEGLSVIIPHLNLGPVPGSASTSSVKRLYDAGLNADAIEVAHPLFSKRHTQTAIEVATEHAITQVGSSDDHEGNIGRRYCTLIPQITDDPIVDFITALHDKTAVPIPSGLNLLPVSEIGEVIRSIKAILASVKLMASPRFFNTAIAYYGREIFER